MRANAANEVELIDGIFCRKNILDKISFLNYNIKAMDTTFCPLPILYGGAMVSTGILRYDKRGEPGNLVNCPI